MSVMENWTQTSFRYRDDDGSESAATWRQLVNVDDSLLEDTTYRMRFLITGTHTGGSGSFDFTGGFQYNLNSAGWNPITTSSSVVKAVASADTSWTINDDDATTEQLAGSATFVAGHMDETGTCSAVSMSETQESEFELVFQIVGTDVSPGNTVEIRMVDSGSALATYSNTPSITVAAAGTTIDVPIGAAVTSGTTNTLGHSIAVGLGTVSITGYAPARGAGLRVVGYAPTVTVESAGNTTVDVPLGSVITSGLGITLDHSIQMGLGAATVGQLAPTLGTSVALPLGTSLTGGLVPSISEGYVVNPGVGSSTVAGTTITLDVSIAIPAGSVTTAGLLPSLGGQVNVDVPLGSAVTSGFAPTLDLSVQIGLGSATTTTYQPVLQHGIAVPVASITTAGLTPTLDTGIAVPLGQQTITLYSPTLGTSITIGVGTSVTQGYAPTVTVATPSVAVSKRRGRVKRKRYYTVEIDGEQFVFNTVQEVVDFLAEIEETVPLAAERDLDRPVSPVIPSVTVKTVRGRATQAKAITDKLGITQRRINRAYSNAIAKRKRQRAIDREISELLTRKIRHEEDEARIIALLML